MEVLLNSPELTILQHGELEPAAPLREALLALHSEVSCTVATVLTGGDTTEGRKNAAKRRCKQLKKK